MTNISRVCMKMMVHEVMQIIKKFEAEARYGKKGLNKKVKYIEVMEIPHVDKWNVKETLILTSFYAIKDDEQAQINIVKSFIELKASGLIIKLGRFIDEIPPSIVQLAEEHHFPIITLPKDVPYIDILTPLYAKLQQSTDDRLIEEIEGKSYENVTTILQDIYKSFGLVMYIENMNGELLYCAHKLKSDKWRNDFTLFSLPTYEQTEMYVQKFNTEFETYEKHACIYSEALKRMVVTLFAKGKKYGLLHIVYERNKQKELLMDTEIFRLVDKIHITMMAEIVSLQMQKGEFIERWNYLEDEKDLKMVIHLAQLNITEAIGYHTFLRKSLILLSHIENMMKHLTEVKDYIVMERNENVFVLVWINHREATSIELKHQWKKQQPRTLLENVKIGISYPFIDTTSIIEKVDNTAKVIEIGKDLGLNSTVYDQSELGISSILLNLQKDPHVNDFVHYMMLPLQQMEADLIETLKVYLAENCNASRTAKVMYLNRRTITYRLKRIREIMNIDLNDAKTIFSLQYCFYMMND